MVEVSAPSEAVLRKILAQIADHGAMPTAAQDCRLETVDIEGTFPEGFYSTTNQRTRGPPGRATGFRSTTRRWTAASWSSRGEGRPAACR